MGSSWEQWSEAGQKWDSVLQRNEPDGLLSRTFAHVAEVEAHLAVWHSEKCSRSEGVAMAGKSDSCSILGETV